MPTEGSTRRAFRLEEDELWEDFRVTAEQDGWDRSALLRDFIDWHARQPERSTYRRRRRAAE